MFHKSRNQHLVGSVTQEKVYLADCVVFVVVIHTVCRSGNNLYGCVTHPSLSQPAAARLFVCFCIVRGFEEEDSQENVHSVLFCLN